MTLFNVRVAVCELVEADSAEDAVRRLRELLEGHGFQPYLYPLDGPDAFESEDTDEDPATPSPSCAEHLRGAVS